MRFRKPSFGDISRDEHDGEHEYGKYAEHDANEDAQHGGSAWAEKERHPGRVWRLLWEEGIGYSPRSR